jgi:hypothetical protein
MITPLNHQGCTNLFLPCLFGHIIFSDSIAKKEGSAMKKRTTIVFLTVVFVPMMVAVGSGKAVAEGRSKGERAFLIRKRVHSIAYPSDAIAAAKKPPNDPKAGADTDPDMDFVPDVRGQFAALSHRAEALGLGISDSPDPTQSHHYQGIIRSRGLGTPYFFVTRADDGHPGNLLVIKMGSRPTHGERMRSNRMWRGIDTDDTAPDNRDKVVKSFSFDGNNGWPHYDHAGAMQLVGKVLAVGLEGPLGSETREDIVVFLDVSNPESPTVLGELDIAPHGDAASLAALTKTAHGTYVLVVTGRNNDYLWVFESTSTGFKDPGFAWNFLDQWSESQDEQYLGASWPSDLCSWDDWDCNHPHQALNFVREGSLAGDLYIIGTRNKSGGGPFDDDDYFDLYKAEWCNNNRTTCQTEPASGLQFTLRHVQTRHISAKSTSDGEDLVNFAASGGVYISPTGEIIIYGTEHDNDGPKDDNGRGTIRAGEWRHHNMVRPGSPTYFPTAVPGGPYEVPEGGSITLAGAGEPAATKAWIELFQHSDWEGRSIVIDFDDWDLEDFDHFGNHDSGFSDTASSWRWFAPVSCTLRVNEHDFYHDDFPGKKTKTLYGNGVVNAEAHLKTVKNDANNEDLNDELTSMQFFPDCEDYYSQPIEVWWDLDGDGDYETAGETPVFSAVGLDGPDVVTVGLMAMHPSDGTSGTAEVSITITNVPPEIESFDITDSSGMEICEEPPVTLVGIEIAVDVTFTDPGIPDTHTATIEWGDGTIDDLGAVVGTVNGSHAYDAAGNYTIVVTVTDDDGGVGTATTPIEVVEGQDALHIVIDMLMPHAANRHVRKAIHKTAGALHLWDRSSPNAVMQKIKQALRHMEEAESSDSNLDLTCAQGLSAMTAKAIAVEAIERTEEIADKPNEYRKIEQAKDLVEKGDECLAAYDYVCAVTEYQKAVRKLQSIWKKNGKNK